MLTRPPAGCHSLWQSLRVAMHLPGEQPWSVCPVCSNALSAFLAQVWLDALSSTRHLSWLLWEVERGWLWPCLGTGAGPDLNYPHAPWSYQAHIPPAMDCDTIYSIFNRGKTGRRSSIFRFFSDHFFKWHMGNWLDLGWVGGHRGAAPTSVPLLLCWPHSAFPRGCWGTRQLKVCCWPSGRGDSVISESPAVTLVAPWSTPEWAVLLCSGLYPCPIPATLRSCSRFQKGTGTSVTVSSLSTQSSPLPPCHHLHGF